MASLEKINPNKPLSIYGSKTIISDDKELVELAKSLGNERFRFIATPVTEAIKITGRETKTFLELVKLLSRAFFEENLQGLAQTKRGDLLLTGWMSLDQFKSFLDEFCACPLAPSSLCLQLAEPFAQWRALGVEEVYFDGYEIARESAIHERC